VVTTCPSFSNNIEILAKLTILQNNLHPISHLVHNAFYKIHNTRLKTTIMLQTCFPWLLYQKSNNISIQFETTFVSYHAKRNMLGNYSNKSLWLVGIGLFPPTIFQIVLGHL
jgi:hypothetical protein